MQYMKLSTSRDFRINAATLDAALQEQDDSDEVSAACRTVASSSRGSSLTSLAHSPVGSVQLILLCSHESGL